MSGVAFGFLIAAGVFVFTLVLPLVSFARARQARRMAGDAQRRLDHLEAEVARLSISIGHARNASALDPSATAPHFDVPVPLTETPVAPAPVAGDDSLEQQIGSRWLLYLGIAGLVLGMSYFVKFAFDNGWVSEKLRVAAAGVTGAGLIVAGVRFSARALPLFGQALAGGGVVVLYLAIYGALHFYGLIAPAPAFVLMAALTTGAAFLAHRERAQALALLAALGGFATPLLIGGDRSVQIVLFIYIGILISGTLILLKRHSWPLLGLAAYGCTFVLVLMWMVASYEPEAWLRTELFLTAYVSMFLYLSWMLERRGNRYSAPTQLAKAGLSTAPLAFHVTSLYLLHGHAAALLLYVILFSVAGIVAATLTRRVWIRLLTLLLVGMPLMSWMASLEWPRWHVAALVTVCVIYGLHLAAQWHAVTDARESGVPVVEAVYTHVNGLLLPMTLYVFLDARFAWWNPWMAAILATLNAGIAWVIHAGAPGLYRHYVALSATLAAVAMALAFDGPVVALGWAVEGAVLGWLALHERSRLLGTSSAVMIGLGAIQLTAALLQPLAVRAWPLLNPRAAVATMAVALLAWLGWQMRDDARSEVRGRLRDAVIILANLLVLGFLSADIHAFFSQRALRAGLDGQGATVADAGLMQQVALSVTWAAYAVGLVGVGIRRRYAPARYFAMVLFAITIVKVIARDIAELDRLYRMLSVLAVGVLLVAASYLYQRMERDTAPPAP